MWLEDDGGMERGGMNMSNISTFTIQVVHVNQRPYFEISSAVSVVESNSRNITEFARNISAGSPNGNENYQNLSFTLVQTSGDTSLFLSGPSIVIVGSQGTLEFVLNGTNHGNTTFDVYLTDDGGTDDGGMNISTTASFSLDVLLMNHAPSFEILNTSLDLQESASDWKGIQVDNFIQILSKGDVNEEYQLLWFETSWNFPGIDKVGLEISCYDKVPASPKGLCANHSAFLDIRLPQYRWGSFQVNVTLHDSGGRMYGGNFVYRQHFARQSTPFVRSHCKDLICETRLRWGSGYHAMEHIAAGQ
jgi:hypothetical protein